MASGQGGANAEREIDLGVGAEAEHGGTIPGMFTPQPTNPTMTPRQRLWAWIAVLAGVLLIGPAAWLGPGGRVGVGLITPGLLGTMLWLLETTPQDAIKLRRWTSVVCVACGAAWQAWVQALGLGMDGPAAGANAGVLGLVALGWAWWLSSGGVGLSPWWAAAGVWGPGLMLLAWGREAGTVTATVATLASTALMCGYAVLPWARAPRGWVVLAGRGMLAAQMLATLALAVAHYA